MSEHICTICKDSTKRYHRTNESWERHQQTDEHQLATLRAQNEAQAEVIEELRKALKKVLSQFEQSDFTMNIVATVIHALKETEQK